MRLTLKKQTLTELTNDELATVAGGITTLQLKSLQECSNLETTPTLPVFRCVTDLTS